MFTYNNKQNKLYHHILRYGTHNALAQKKNGDWVFTSYKEYYEQVRTCAKAFIKLGLERFHGVCILGFNSPEWFLADLGAIFAGWVTFITFYLYSHVC